MSPVPTLDSSAFEVGVREDPVKVDLGDGERTIQQWFMESPGSSPRALSCLTSLLTLPIMQLNGSRSWLFSTTDIEPGDDPSQANTTAYTQVFGPTETFSYFSVIGELRVGVVGPLLSFSNHLEYTRYFILNRLALIHFLNAVHMPGPMLSSFEGVNLKHKTF